MDRFIAAGALLYSGISALALMAGGVQAIWVERAQGLYLGPWETVGGRIALIMWGALIAAVPFAMIGWAICILRGDA